MGNLSLGEDFVKVLAHDARRGLGHLRIRVRLQRAHRRDELGRPRTGDNVRIFKNLEGGGRGREVGWGGVGGRV